ncbi:MAG: signal peptidase I [Candidatus Vogelbacteria bacterium]|nr:signal peptidase I [Candidatus Vogelbacteria bacterium]
MTEKPRRKSTWWEIIRFVLVTLIIVVPIRTYVAQPFIVSGLSMVPSFDDGEYLIIDELSYLFRSPLRDEVIVFRYPKDPTKFFIKRVVNLPGETVTIQNSAYQLQADEYFVLGDNRDRSLDSRAWGPVAKKLIKGRVFLRLFPFNRIAFLPTANSQNEPE